MLRVRWLGIAVLVVALPLVCRAAGDPPIIIYTADLNHPERSAPYPGKREIRKIQRFVASVPGICHRIQEIHLESASNAEVRTGRRPPSFDDPHPDHGDKLYLHKRDGVWHIVRKTKWHYEGKGGLFTETS